MGALGLEAMGEFLGKGVGYGVSGYGVGGCRVGRDVEEGTRDIAFCQLGDPLRNPGRSRRF